MQQTIVMKVSLTFDPKALVAWNRRQKGVCCDAPAHEDSMFVEEGYPELAAQSILAHALLATVTDIITAGSVDFLDTGIPEEVGKRITANYEESLAEQTQALAQHRGARCTCGVAWTDEQGRHLKYNPNCPDHGMFRGALENVPVTGPSCACPIAWTGRLGAHRQVIDDCLAHGFRGYYKGGSQ